MQRSLLPPSNRLASGASPYMWWLNQITDLSWLCVGYMTLQKLSPVVAYHQKLLDKFSGITTANWRTRMPQRWSRTETAVWILGHFQSGYEELDEKTTTAAKMEELLLVLASCPLHNNAGTIVLRRNIMVLNEGWYSGLCPLLLRP